MSHKRILCTMAWLFFLVLTDSALAVEPTTFPGTKDKTAPNKAVPATPKTAPQAKDAPGKQSNGTGMLLESTSIQKNAPIPKKK